LRVYEKAIIAGDSLPQFQIREISAEGRTVFRYYQPMSIQPLCLTCHGPVENIPEKLRSALAAYYPDDRATGYNNGDFRGVVRVTINSAK
jgi:hypothetical protein